MSQYGIRDGIQGETAISDAAGQQGDTTAQSKESEQKAVERFRQALPLIVVLMLGLTIIDAWCDVLGHGTATMASNALVQDALTNGRVFWSLSLIIFCLVIAAFPSLMEKAERPMDVAFSFLACAGSATFVLAGDARISSAALAVASIVITGFCYGWFEIRLLAECARLEKLSWAAWIIVASRVLKTVLEPAMGTLPPSVLGLADAVLPLVLILVFAYLRLTRKGTSIVSAVEPHRLSLSENDQSTILVLLALFPLTNAIARALSNLGFWGVAYPIDASNSAVSIISSCLFIILAGITIGRGNSRHRNIRSKEGSSSGAETSLGGDEKIMDRLFLALVISLGCIIFFDGETLDLAGVPQPVKSSLTTLSELYSHFLFWAIAVVAIRTVDQHPYRLAACTELAMSSAAIILGLALQYTGGMGALAVSVVMYAIVVGGLYMLWRSRGTVVNAPQGGVEEACARIAAEHRLTPRETEVLTYLAQGRSKPYIQEQLSLSASTVKAHTAHIYQKLGVHNKQELISLFR